MKNRRKQEGQMADDGVRGSYHSDAKHCREVKGHQKYMISRYKLQESRSMGAYLPI